MNKPQDSDHWLVRPSTIRLLWWVFSIVLAALLGGRFEFELSKEGKPRYFVVWAPKGTMIKAKRSK